MAKKSKQSVNCIKEEKRVKFGMHCMSQNKFRSTNLLYLLGLYTCRGFGGEAFGYIVIIGFIFNALS